MKRIFLLTVLSVLAIGCIGGPPNPGFRVETQVEVRQGFFPFQIDIPVDKGGTVSDGVFIRVLEGPQLITGTEVIFTGKTSNSLGFFDVPNGKTPSTWTLQAVSGWNLGIANCNGQGTAFVARTGDVSTLKCDLVGGFGFPFAPPAVSQNSVFPNELQATVPNVNTDYGMPVFHFEDHTGTVVRDVTATTVINGADVKVNPSSLKSLPIGRYRVKVYNAVSSGTASGQPIGYSTITVSNHPCPGLEEQIVSCYNSQYFWNWTHCYCSAFPQ